MVINLNERADNRTLSRNDGDNMLWHGINQCVLRQDCKYIVTKENNTKTINHTSSKLKILCFEGQKDSKKASHRIRKNNCKSYI